VRSCGSEHEKSKHEALEVSLYLTEVDKRKLEISLYLTEGDKRKLEVSLYLTEGDKRNPQR
jgi:hypothetical protein